MSSIVCLLEKSNEYEYVMLVVFFYYSLDRSNEENAYLPVGTRVRSAGFKVGALVGGKAFVGLVVGLGVPRIETKTVPEHLELPAQPSLIVNSWQAPVTVKVMREQSRLLGSFPQPLSLVAICLLCSSNSHSCMSPLHCMLGMLGLGQPLIMRVLPVHAVIRQLSNVRMS